jgi:hypothetical protein
MNNMSLHSVNTTGVSQRVIDGMKKWRKWLDYVDGPGSRCGYVCLDTSVIRRDAEYVVQGLQACLHLETWTRGLAGNDTNYTSREKQGSVYMVTNFRTKPLPSCLPFCKTPISWRDSPWMAYLHHNSADCWSHCIPTRPSRFSNFTGFSMLMMF